MKIAITSTDKNINSNLDQRFGRCSNFLIFNDKDWEKNPDVVDNNSIASGGGAGIAAAQSLIDKNIDVLITGNVGPNAINTLKAAGIDVHLAQGGTISENLEKFKLGKLEKTEGANVGGHHGM